MPTVQEKNRAQFNQKFNDLLGNKIGKPLKNYSDNEIYNSISPDIVTKMAAMLAKPKTIPKPKKTVAGIKTPTNAAALLGITAGEEETITPVVPSAPLNLPEINKSKADSSGVWGAVKGTVGWLDENITNNPVTDRVQNNPGTRLLADPVKKTLDLLTRPGYAVTGALNSASDGTREGDSAWSLPKNFVQGAWDGFSGRKKEGFGDLIDNPSLFAQDSELTRKMIEMGVWTEDQKQALIEKDKNKTGVEQWSKRIAGLSGDLLTDPTTYFGGGAVTAAKGATSRGIRKGVEATGRDALKASYVKLAREVLDEVEDSAIKGVTRRVPNSMSNERRLLTEDVMDEMSKKVDDFVVDTKSGHMVGGGARDAHGTMAQLTAKAYLDANFKLIEKASKRVIDKLKAGYRFTDAEFAKIARDVPGMQIWITSAKQAYDEAATLGKVLNVDQMAMKANGAYLRTLETAANEINAKMVSRLKDTTLRIPRVSYMGYDMYLPRIGKALHAAKRVDKVRPENLRRTMNYSAWIPGTNAHVVSKHHALGAAEYEAFRQDLRRVLANTTHADRKLLQEAKYQMRTLDGPLGEIQPHFNKMYDDIYWKESGEGFRSTNTTPFAPDYVYTKVNWGANNIKFDRDWKGPKKKSVRRNHSIKGFTPVEAKKKGLKIELDGGEALLARKAKSIRDLSKAAIEKDIVTNFGFKSQKLHPQAVADRKLVQLRSNKYPWLKGQLQPGEVMYIDRSVEDVLDSYNELLKYGNNVQANDFVRVIEKLTTFWKTQQTIIWPAFHLRNMITDAFFGMFDGVKSSRYGQVLKAMANKEKNIKLGPHQVPFWKIEDSYFNTTASGFMHADINPIMDKAGLGKAGIMSSPTKIVPGLRHLSTKREDFGRLVHYFHAMDEEYAAKIAKGYSPEKAWREAEIAANWRVNKFKFDYNALTPGEQKLRRYGMPFYTYMRKSTPVLIENLFLNPKYFSYIGRMQNALAPSEEFTGAKAPDYSTENNLMLWSDDENTEEPFGFTDALFPTRSLTDLWDNPTKRVSPFIQAPFEYGKEDLFTGKPVGTGLSGIADIVKNKFKATSFFGNIENPDKTTGEKWASFLGIPITQVTKAKQEGRDKQLISMLDEKVEGMNRGLVSKGVKISVRSGQVYVIQPKSPTADEIKYNKEPRYPENAKEKVLGVYNSFEEIPKL